MPGLLEASNLLERFHRGSFREVVAGAQARLCGATNQNAEAALRELGLTAELLIAALLVKKHSGQIHELIHTIGIAVGLPKILEPGEEIEQLSLAAGNTGTDFDLITNYRLAEFTFIQWRGADVRRQNKVFKDFYFLAEAITEKRRELWVVGRELPIKFFKSGRAVLPIVSDNAKLAKSFSEKYGSEVTTVRDYYLPRSRLVKIRDLNDVIPNLG